MARFRLSRQAEADIAHALDMSELRFGDAARRRYAALLIAAMRKVAADPNGPATRDRAELAPGLRSLHLRSMRSGDAKVRSPVHVLYYRATAPELIEIVRVLHERMEPSRHVPVSPDDAS